MMRFDEEWLVIPGHPDFMVSDMGRVKWLTDKRKYKAGDISTGSRSRDYYRLIGIDGKNYGIHRLVMLAFVGKCPEGLEVNHKNGKKYDNRLSNLEYVTHQENVRHSRGLGWYDEVRKHHPYNHKFLEEFVYIPDKEYFPIVKSPSSEHIDELCKEINQWRTIHKE